MSELSESRHDWSMARDRICVRCGAKEWPQHPTRCSGKRPVMDAQPAPMDETMDADDWTPDPRTVRACIEALPVQLGLNDSHLKAADVIVFCRTRLEALLPKPDPVEVLVREIEQSKLVSTEGCGGTSFVETRSLVKWLIETGRMKL